MSGRLVYNSILNLLCQYLFKNFSFFTVNLFLDLFFCAKRTNIKLNNLFSWMSKQTFSSPFWFHFWRHHTSVFLAIFNFIWYTVFATQLNIWTDYRRSVFISVKMHSPFWLSLIVCQSCVAASGVMHFSCVASAAHFFYLGGNVYDGFLLQFLILYDILSLRHKV